MSLEEEIHPLVGQQRRFMLFRIANVDADKARTLCDVTRGVYNHWFDEPVFVTINRKRDELSKTYKKEALSMLRKDNQITAILLEEALLNEMKAELDTRDYNLIKTPLAREVYVKAMESITPEAQSQAGWPARIQQLFVNTPPPQVRVIGAADDRQLQTDQRSEEQHAEGELLPPSEQELPEGEENVQSP